MTLHSTDTAPAVTRHPSAVPGDIGYDSCPTTLTHGERLAYRRGFDASTRKQLRDGTVTAPGVCHDPSSGDTAPAPGTAARRLLGVTLAAAGRDYRARKHAACHESGMRAVRAYLRKQDKLAGERRALTGEPDPATPYAARRWEEITGGTTPTRRPAVRPTTPTTDPAPDPAPVKLRKTTRVDLCSAHTRRSGRHTRRELVRWMVEGGFGSPCTGTDGTDVCHLTPGTDHLTADLCTGATYACPSGYFTGPSGHFTDAPADDPTPDDPTPVNGSLPVPGADELAAAGRLTLIHVTDTAAAAPVKWHRMTVHGDVAACGWTFSDRDDSTADMPAGGMHPAVTCPDCLAGTPAADPVPDDDGTGDGDPVPACERDDYVTRFRVVDPGPVTAADAAAVHVDPDHPGRVERVEPVNGSLTDPADDDTGQTWTRAGKREARRKLAAERTAAGLVISGPAWYAACATAGIPVPDGTVTA